VGVAWVTWSIFENLGPPL